MTIYTPNVPQGNQQIASTQVPILNNFGYINTAMQVDHIWTDNLANTPSDGSHNTLSMPNQGSDIASLPTGINVVQYAIGNNLYTWNGAKNPVSGVSGRGTVAITGLNTFHTMFSIPAECIGWVSIQESPGATFPFTKTFHFFSSASSTPTELFDEAYLTVGASRLLTVAIVGGNVQVARADGGSGPGNDYTAQFKYIYWPI